jgi:hypothetical protein
MTHSSKALSSFLYLSLAAIAGCGGGSLAPEPGQSALVASATSFSVVSSGGGFVLPQPAGAACDAGLWTYTVHLDSGAFDWDRCDVNNQGAEATDYVPSAGTRTLSTSELDAIRTKARLVHVSHEMICGADAPTLHMTVTAPTGSIVYGDDFYSCLKQDEAYVETASLWNLASALKDLVLPTR